MSAAAAVRSYLAGMETDMVAMLETLVRMETPSDKPETQDQILTFLREAFRDVGCRTLRLPARKSGGHLYAALPRRRGDDAGVQLLLGHCDTVWPVGTLEKMPLVRDGDVLKGPGVYDMKAGVVEMIFALRCLRDLELAPAVTPLVFINSDEEIGSRESTRYVRALARIADRALVMEPSLGPGGYLKTARKGVGRFTVTVQGKAAHAGLDPEGGASAILELSHVIQKLFALNDPERGASVNVGLIDGGVRANVIAPQSSAVVDVRVASQTDAERIEQTILALKAETDGVTLEIDGRIGRPPLEHTPANRQLWRMAATLAADLDMQLAEGTAGGGSDGNTTSLYTATLDGLGAVGDGAHAAHEHIQVSQLAERCALLALLLLAPPLASPKAGQAA
ncbi:MAG: M20 family metallopeptidase [Gammaproteobacteria bacterium]|nr:M20 family metallopeptidase [Gammaproteobacteria bacterium]NNM00062.1 M20 family metallopeptidase [Gammaproteobacteria bacterium]